MNNAEKEYIHDRSQLGHSGYGDCSVDPQLANAEHKPANRTK